MRIAGKERSAGALAEYVKLVWLIPAMDGLFTGTGVGAAALPRPARARRRSRSCASPLGRYDRAMRQRNRLFQMREGSRALFEGLEEQMAEAGVAIAAARRRCDRAARWLIERMRAARGDGPFPWARARARRRLEARLGSRPATEVEDAFAPLVLEQGRDARPGGSARP